MDKKLYDSIVAHVMPSLLRESINRDNYSQTIYHWELGGRLVVTSGKSTWRSKSAASSGLRSHFCEFFRKVLKDVFGEVSGNNIFVELGAKEWYTPAKDSPAEALYQEFKSKFTLMGH